MSFPPKTLPYEHQLETGQFFGFRIEEASSGEPTIADVRGNTPAAAGNLKRGDVIARINGRSVDELEDPVGRRLPPFAAAKEYLKLSGPRVSLTLGDGRFVHLRLNDLPAKSLPVHPTQIYSSINAFLLLMLLIAYYPFRRRDGEVIAILLTLYPVTRFLLEWIRCDEPPQFGTALTISQNVSVVMLVLVIGLWIYVLRQPPGTVWPAERRS
jgi:phosphatidylglycerol:prolipoprotein diacylglycerol transferase